jgi:hypothetical protein
MASASLQEMSVQQQNFGNHGTFIPSMSTMTQSSNGTTIGNGMPMRNALTNFDVNSLQLLSTAASMGQNQGQMRVPVQGQSYTLNRPGQSYIPPHKPTLNVAVPTPQHQAKAEASAKVSPTVAEPVLPKKSRKKLCVSEGCGKQCSFNYEWETKARYCSTHKLVDMVDVKHKTCEIQGCNKQPYFNYENIRKGRFCAAHKLYNMVNVKNRSCEAPGCVTQPSFNFYGRSTGVYCSIHKLPNMVNVKNKVCAATDCIKIPTYNYVGESKAIYCSAHKKANMFDIVNKRCETNGCMKSPKFNFEGQTACRFCESHKLNGMVDRSEQHQTGESDEVITVKIGQIRPHCEEDNESEMQIKKLRT